jgi:site-specific DNA recombinase
MKRVRCAIYTRKSSEEGLEQDFNSLDAQRESCEAYVKSQTSLGWRVLPQRFDDGGISGGTLERPALQRLLTALDEQRVDVIVIYKIDRLTRSLTDFAKLAERFEKLKVSFVSVTQQFNTATSMGRLMLNVLLSFAQFEREITGERIRDKIKASKRKGMWMGGMVPLGYDLADRALHVNPAEAKTVHRLYEMYLNAGSVTALHLDAKSVGLRTKARIRPDGSQCGNKILSRGHLHRILSNPLYRGQIAHKGERFPGLHEPIIDQVLWDKVQTLLESNRAGHQRRKTAEHTSLLTGLLYDAAGNRYLPSHTTRHNKRYRYYGRTTANAEGNNADLPAHRLPADQIERPVRAGLLDLLTTPGKIKQAIGKNLTARQLSHMVGRARKLAERLNDAGSQDWREALANVLVKVTVSLDSLQLHFSRAQLKGQLCDLAGSPYADADIWVLELPCEFRNRGQQLRIMLGGPEALPAMKPDPTLLKMMRRAHQWREQLETGPAVSIKDLAEKNNVNGSYFTRVLRLAYLAPDIVDAIITGRQPIDLTATRLVRMHDLPNDWPSQREYLSFSNA